MTSFSSRELPERMAKRQRTMVQSDEVSDPTATLQADTPGSSGGWDLELNTLLYQYQVQQELTWMEISHRLSRKFSNRSSRSSGACSKQWSKMIKDEVSIELLPPKMRHPDRHNERASDWNTSPENTEMEITLRANSS